MSENIRKAIEEINQKYSDINIDIMGVLDELEKSVDSSLEPVVAVLYNTISQNVDTIRKLINTKNKFILSGGSRKNYIASDLDEIANIAEAFDKSGDNELQKQARVLDELLLAIASPKDTIARIKKAYEDDLNKLREEYREKSIKNNYEDPREELHESYAADYLASAVDKEVKKYRPLEAPLSTRYVPDAPGVQAVRIADGVYQDPITGKIYNYQAGYTTNKGNKVPGGGVEFQSKDVASHQSQSPFTTREGLMSSKV